MLVSSPQRVLVRSRALPGAKVFGGQTDRISVSCFCIRCLREPNIHAPKRVFSPNRQVCDEEELLPAFSYISLYPIVRAPGLLQGYPCYRRIKCAARPSSAHFLHLFPSPTVPMPRPQLEITY